MGNSYSVDQFSDIETYYLTSRKVGNQKLDRKSQSVEQFQNQTGHEEEVCATHQAKFPVEDQKMCNSPVPTLTKEEDLKIQLEDEKTKNRLLEETIEKLHQEMKNKDVENASLNSQIFELNEVVTEGSENNKLLFKKLSEVEEDLSNIISTLTRTAVEIDMHPIMDCSHESEQFQRSHTHIPDSDSDTENQILEHFHLKIGFEDSVELQVDVLDAKDKVADNFVCANDSGVDLKADESIHKNESYPDQDSARSKLYNMDTRLQQAEQEIVRLVKQVTELIRDDEANKKELQAAHDLIAQSNEVILKLQSNAHSMEIIYKSMINQLTEDLEIKKKKTAFSFKRKFLAFRSNSGKRESLLSRWKCT